MGSCIDRQGPDWPLGFVEVAVPGTPVGLMVNVDPNNYGDPSTPMPNTGVATQVQQYTVRANQIIIQAVKPAAHGTTPNAGNIYLCRDGYDRDDPDGIIGTIVPGETFILGPSATVRDVFSPYRYFLDADNADDGALVCLLIF